MRALEALDAIGLADQANRLRRAIALFPDGGPSELDRLDRGWEPSIVRVAAYVRARAEAFHVSP